MLRIINVITRRDLEVISDKFNILGTCCGGNYDQKRITKLHDYCFIVQADQSQYIRICRTKVDHKIFDYHFTVFSSFTL